MQILLCSVEQCVCMLQVLSKSGNIHISYKHIKYLKKDRRETDNQWLQGNPGEKTGKRGRKDTCISGMLRSHECVIY